MRITFLSALIAFFYYGITQPSSVVMRGDFAEAAKFGRLQGAEGLPSYSSGEVKGSRYFSSSWGLGKLVPYTGEKVNNLLVMFDKQEHNIYIKKDGQPEIILLDKNQIKNFELDNHLFVSGKTLTGGDEGKYYERLTGTDDKLQLYKLITTKYVKANKTDLERIKSGEFNDEFIDEVSYYVKAANQPIQPIRLREKNLIKAIPAQEAKIKSYIDEHSREPMDEAFIKHIIDFLNE